MLRRMLRVNSEKPIGTLNENEWGIIFKTMVQYVPHLRWPRGPKKRWNEVQPWMKSKKLRSAERVGQFESILQCPICEHSMSVVDFKSLRWMKKHTFDFSKQGYVNLLTKSSNCQYHKQLFEARQKMISERGMYRLMHKEMKRLITKYMGPFCCTFYDSRSWVWWRVSSSKRDRW